MYFIFQIFNFRYEEYLDRLITSTEESHEIKFAEYLIFYQFLNSLEDFAMAMRMYTLADRPISKGMFSQSFTKIFFEIVIYLNKNFPR